MIRRLVTESAIYGMAGILQRLGALLLLPMCAHLFTPAEFGALGLALTTAVLLSIFFTFGLDNSAHRWFWDTAEDSDRRKTIASWFWFNLGAAAMAGMLLASISPWLAGTLLEDVRAWPMLAILGAGLPVSVIGNVCSNWLRMQRRARDSLILALVFVATQVVAALGLVVGLDNGIVGYCSAQVLAAAITALVGLIMMQGWINPGFCSRIRLAEMLRFSFPLIPASLALWTTASFNRYAIGAWGTQDAVGLFHLGSTIGLVMSLFTGAFQQAWGPFALSIHKHKGCEQIYATVFLGVIIIGSLATCVLSAFSPDVIRLVAVEGYAPAACVVGPVAFTCVLTALSYVLAIGPTIAKDNRPMALSILLGGATAVIANLALVPISDLDGAALAGVVAQVVAVVWLYVKAQTLLSFPYPWRAGLAILILAMMTLVAIRFLLDDAGLACAGLRLLACVPLSVACLWFWKRRARIVTKITAEVQVEGETKHSLSEARP